MGATKVDGVERISGRAQHTQPKKMRCELKSRDAAHVQRVLCGRSSRRAVAYLPQLVARSADGTATDRAAVGATSKQVVAGGE